MPPQAGFREAAVSERVVEVLQLQYYHNKLRSIYIVELQLARRKSFCEQP